MTITTVFATWFGSESVVGIPPVFINDGLRGTIAEPIGTGFCLIIVSYRYSFPWFNFSRHGGWSFLTVCFDSLSVFSFWNLFMTSLA